MIAKLVFNDAVKREITIESINDLKLLFNSYSKSPLNAESLKLSWRGQKLTIQVESEEL